MRVNYVLAALSFAALAVVGYHAPTYITPQIAKDSIQRVDRTYKSDRLAPTFEGRWSPVYSIRTANYPALYEWLSKHGVSPVVAEGN